MWGIQMAKPAASPWESWGPQYLYGVQGEAEICTTQASTSTSGAFSQIGNTDFYVISWFF